MGVVHTLAQLHLDRLELGSHSLLERFANDDKRAHLRDRVQKCVKSRKSNVSGFPSPSLACCFGRVAAKTDRLGLVPVQRQFETHAVLPGPAIVRARAIKAFGLTETSLHRRRSADGGGGFLSFMIVSQGLAYQPRRRATRFV